MCNYRRESITTVGDNINTNNNLCHPGVKASLFYSCLWIMKEAQDKGKGKRSKKMFLDRCCQKWRRVLFRIPLCPALDKIMYVYHYFIPIIPITLFSRHYDTSAKPISQPTSSSIPLLTFFVILFWKK